MNKLTFRPLSPVEHELKEQCEEAIRAGLATFVEVGQALMTVRDQRLYRSAYATFEEYCAGEWQIDRSRGYQLMSAARVVSTIVDSGLPAPTNEGQARELARAPEEQRGEVWQKALDATDNKPTAAAIAQVRHEAAAPPTAIEPIEEPAPMSTSPAVDPWTDDERQLRSQVEAGVTVVASLRGQHDRLIRWAETNGRFQRIDRRTEWGNPFETPVDGDRDTVIKHYADHYLAYKPSLLDKLDTLVGKVLGCWCAPEACHGDVLKEATEQ